MKVYPAPPAPSKYTITKALGKYGIKTNLNIMGGRSPGGRSPGGRSPGGSKSSGLGQGRGGGGGSSGELAATVQNLGQLRVSMRYVGMFAVVGRGGGGDIAAFVIFFSWCWKGGSKLLLALHPASPTPRYGSISAP